MKMPFLLISPKIVPKIQLIKKGRCFECHAVIADKIEYRYVHAEFEDDDVDGSVDEDDNEPV